MIIISELIIMYLCVASIVSLVLILCVGLFCRCWCRATARFHLSSLVMKRLNLSQVRFTVSDPHICISEVSLVVSWRTHSYLYPAPESYREAVTYMCYWSYRLVNRLPSWTFANVCSCNSLQDQYQTVLHGETTPYLQITSVGQSWGLKVTTLRSGFLEFWYSVYFGNLSTNSALC